MLPNFVLQGNNSNPYQFVLLLRLPSSLFIHQQSQERKSNELLLLWVKGTSQELLSLLLNHKSQNMKIRVVIIHGQISGTKHIGLAVSISVFSTKSSLLTARRISVFYTWLTLTRKPTWLAQLFLKPPVCMATVTMASHHKPSSILNRYRHLCLFFSRDR